MFVDAMGVIALVVYFGTVFAVWANFFSKAGYPMWCGVLPIIPGINIIAWLYFAFREWPIETELRLAKEDLRMLEDRFGLDWRRQIRDQGHYPG